MNRNTSISLGPHFDKFVQSSIIAGRYNNTSEVILAGLRLLEEEEENKFLALKKAIHEGIESGIAEDFNADTQFANVEKKEKWLSFS